MTDNNKIDILGKEKINSRFHNMTPEKKLTLSLRLYQSAWELKKSALKKAHPDWSEIRLHDEVKKFFMNART